MGCISRASYGLVFLTLMVGGALADGPTQGILHGGTDTDSITFGCVPNGSYLECDFVQARVKRVATPDGLAKEIQNAKKQFAQMSAKERSEFTAQCPQLAGIAAAIKNRSLPKNPESLKLEDVSRFNNWLTSMTDIEQTDAVKLSDAFAKSCKAPTEENYVAIARQSYDVKTRTCSISTNSYKQRFSQVDQSKTWVVIQQEGPTGPCGVVNVSKFVKDDWSWNYYAQKVVTNKTGELLPGMACSSLNEEEIVYEWRSKTKQLSCDYIEFNVL
jgi:hypothetical protein